MEVVEMIMYKVSVNQVHVFDKVRKPSIKSKKLPNVREGILFDGVSKESSARSEGNPVSKA